MKKLPLALISSGLSFAIIIGGIHAPLTASIIAFGMILGVFISLIIREILDEYL